jgi:hypothetical protein
MNLGFVGGSASSTGWATHLALPNSADKDADVSLSEGDRRIATAGIGSIRATTALPATGKVIFHCYFDTVGVQNNVVGIAKATASLATAFGADADAYAYWIDHGSIRNNGSNVATGASSAVTGDVASILVDMDALKLYLAINGTWQFSANPNTGSGGVSISSGTYYPGWGFQGAGGSPVTTALNICAVQVP